MCEPISITAAVGTAVSMAMTMAQQQAAAKNQRRMVEASNAANIAEAERQEGYQRQADDVWGGALGRYEGNEAATREAEAIGMRDAALTGAVDQASAPYNPSFGTADDPQVVKSEIARKVAQQLSAGKDQAKAKARLSGGKDFSFGNMIDLGRSGGKLGDIGALSSGSARLLPIEAQTAVNNAYDPPSSLYEVGKTVGRGMQAYGSYYGDPNFAGTYGTIGRDSGKAMDGSWLIGRSGTLGGGV